MTDHSAECRCGPLGLWLSEDLEESQGSAARKSWSGPLSTGHRHWLWANVETRITVAGKLSTNACCGQQGHLSRDQWGGALSLGPHLFLQPGAHLSALTPMTEDTVLGRKRCVCFGGGEGAHSLEGCKSPKGLFKAIPQDRKKSWFLSLGSRCEFVKKTRWTVEKQKKSSIYAICSERFIWTLYCLKKFISSAMKLRPCEEREW